MAKFTSDEKRKPKASPSQPGLAHSFSSEGTKHHSDCDLIGRPFYLVCDGQGILTDHNPMNAYTMKIISRIPKTVNDKQHDGKKQASRKSRTTFARVPEMISDELSLKAGSSAGYSLMQSLTDEGEAHGDIKSLMSARASPARDEAKAEDRCCLSRTMMFGEFSGQGYPSRGMEEWRGQEMRREMG